MRRAFAGRIDARRCAPVILRRDDAESKKDLRGPAGTGEFALALIRGLIRQQMAVPAAVLAGEAIKRDLCGR